MPTNDQEAQLAAIQSEINSVPQISREVEKLQDGCSLMLEFLDNNIVLSKVTSLWKGESGRYTGIRYARRDGNCFYRSAAFAILEALVNDKKLATEFHKHISGISSRLVEDYGNFVEDFCHCALEVVEKIVSGKCTTVEQLYELSTDIDYEYTLYFFRYAVSNYIRSHEEDFLPFVMGLNYDSVNSFCAAEVDAVASESDNVQVVAFARCFKVCIVVEYLDNSEGSYTTRHTFGEGTTDSPEASWIEVTLLYRPGHYDLLYK
uniref:ubiquitinyl hydrolase 1 n=1 Tax=Trypanosoma congolense (strain IL3000) TaxID=1068625 RepID=G0UN03_TRYCI|nr:unnamed protein product [Trypanosoma congolense IL3000]